MEPTANLFTALTKRADQILIKKLSNNDRDWAKPKLDADGLPVPGKRINNQGGPYIPHEQRDCGFFPPLKLKSRKEAGDDIWECFVETRWPQITPNLFRSRLVNYTSKGRETHFTGIPKNAFSDLLPASFLVIGQVNNDHNVVYECLTIDSDSDEAELLAEVFDITPDFLIGIFTPEAIRREERDRVFDFADQVIQAWAAGIIDVFAQKNATMPAPIELARMARQKWLAENGCEKLDPFNLDNPGDVLRQISRGVEWELFKEFQRRERSVELVRLVLGDEAGTYTAADTIRKLVDNFSEIDALMLSASQQRKSRAGYSYEYHIEAMLADGAIPFEKQVIIEARKRSDFLIPSLEWVNQEQSFTSNGFILSAKTTLRERWKQVEREKGTRRLFLTTVDENVAGNVIGDMASIGVQLVVPESLIEARETEYSGHVNVMSFKAFCESHVAPYLRLWS
ncbi:EcoRII-like protein [Sphingomonas sp. PP-F2F-A104-K0414]|uniref:type II restriction endonuclease n=1 Tax=Sphingomonas sp. PP-F2F-A104-K0414 TaxID=2135661 RepID=UPI001042878E|nr:type II restriction endonuclease [Sphingomonas sp. PP-F2F-A104-K0414]TCP99540.1 EcoRII-like protein [Sphingomonas sp. PP-F2F-A104-K0414]